MASHVLERLAGLTTKPEIHRRLLGSYRGPYSLGVTRVPSIDGGEPALLVRVVGDDVARGVPSSLDVDGERIRVVVDGSFEPPRKQ